MSAGAQQWGTGPGVADNESAGVRLTLHDDSAHAAVSPRADTALRVLLALARISASAVLTSEALAREQGLTGRALDPILLDLSRFGVIVGIRGPAGGYRLAWPPAEITLADVITAVDRPLAEACGLTGWARRVRPPADGLDGMWLQVRAGLREVLERHTLAGLGSGSASAGW